MCARTGLAGWAVAVLAAGCSALNPAAFRTGDAGSLLPEAKQFRAAAPQPAPVPRELAKVPLPAYVVEPGDVLLVQPADFDSPARFPADQPVLPDGRIDLGRYGRLPVAGKTDEQIERDVQAAVDAKTPKAGPITVRIVARNSKVYYVLGQVNAPGAFPLQGRKTVLDGIVAAGGLNARASRSNIILSRPTAPGGGRVVLPVCYRQIVQLGDTTTNYQLAPGDRIYVPAQSFGESACGADKEEQRDCGPCSRPQFPALWGPVECQRPRR